MGTNRGAGHATARDTLCKGKFWGRKNSAGGAKMFATDALAPCKNILRMTFSEIAAALPKSAVTSVDNLPFPRIASGKVREIFDLGDALLLVASDRLSAFDVILPDGIPGKGIVLTQMSLWWFAQTSGLIAN